MKQANSAKDLPAQQPLPAFKIILLAGLLVATLDIAAASIQTWLNERNVLTMLQFIASGVFGKRSFSGGIAFGLCGLFFHYCIAFGWTWLFFRLYPVIPFLRRHKVLAGIAYGIIVWAIMTRVVLPVSNAPALPFKIKQAIIGMLIIIAAIGLPLAFTAAAYYRQKLLPPTQQEL